MDAVMAAMQTNDAAAAAMDHDGVLADTLVILSSRGRSWRGPMLGSDGGRQAAGGFLDGST